jgi:hypothetical protein
MTIEEIEKLIAKHGRVTAQPLMDLIVTVVLEAVEAERKACAAWLDGAVDVAELAPDPRRARYTAEVLRCCARGIRARGEA